MFPRITYDNMIYGALADTIAQRQNARYFALLVAFSHFAYLFICQQCATVMHSALHQLRVLTKKVLIAAWHIAYSSALLHHITNIVRVCAEPKMRGVDACSCVAGMQYTQIVRKLTVSDKVCEAMGKHLGGTNEDHAIAVVVLAGLPHPAIVGSINLCPKAGNVFRGILRGHQNLHSGVMLPAIGSGAGAFVCHELYHISRSTATRGGTIHG